MLHGNFNKVQNKIFFWLVISLVNQDFQKLFQATLLEYNLSIILSFH